MWFYRKVLGIICLKDVINWAVKNRTNENDMIEWWAYFKTQGTSEM